MFEQRATNAFREFTPQLAKGLRGADRQLSLLLANNVFDLGLDTVKKAARYWYYFGEGYPTWLDVILRAGFYVGMAKTRSNLLEMLCNMERSQMFEVLCNEIRARSELFAMLLNDEPNEEDDLEFLVAHFLDESLAKPRVVQVSPEITEQFLHTNLPEEFPLPRVCPYHWLVFPSGSTGVVDFCLVADVDLPEDKRGLFLVFPSALDGRQLVAIAEVENGQLEVKTHHPAVSLALHAILLQATQPECVQQPQRSKSWLKQLKKEYGQEAKKLKLPIYLTGAEKAER